MRASLPSFIRSPHHWALLLLALWLLPVGARAQAPAWQTVVAAGSEVSAVAVDAAGNVYVAGTFSGTANFGATTLTSAGKYDVFVAKWNRAAGAYVWAQRAGGPGNDQAAGLAVNGTNVYVTGSFAGPTADFGTTVLASTSAVTNAPLDMFVAKLVDAGPNASFAWAQQAHGGSDLATGVAVSGQNVYVVGTFQNVPTSFGSIVLPTAAYVPSGFVAKLVDAGPSAGFVWAQPAGPEAEPAAVAVNGPNVYVAGLFATRTCAFGSVVLTSAGTGTNNASNGFVAKLTDAGGTGSFTWAQAAGGTGSDAVTALAVQGTAVYTAGYFTGPTAGLGSASVANAGPVGSADLFVAKLTDAGGTGSFTWAQRAGGPGDDVAEGLAIQGDDLYVVGAFDPPTAAFGSTTLVNPGPYGTEIFAAKLVDAGPTGSFAWAQRAGGTANDNATTVAVSGPSVYVAGGITSPTADFGSYSLASIGNRATGFLAALAGAPALATAPVSAASGVQLYPNPARAAATVWVPPAAAGATQAAFLLTDALGRAVRTQVVGLSGTGQAHELDLAGLAPGVYALRVQIGAAAAVRRLAIE